MRLAYCIRCHKEAMVNFHRGNPLADDPFEWPPGEYCAECFESLPEERSAQPRASTGSGKEHNDPGFDNVIRALEEDR